MRTAQYLDVGGSFAFVEQAGKGTPVICLHTAGQSGVQWRHTSEALAACGYSVVTPDLPGHGRSEPAPEGPITDLGEYAAWCLELARCLHLGHFYMVGCSIGGKIALDVASRAPDQLHGVVAMAANACAEGKPSERGLRRELSDVAAPSRADRTYWGTLAVVGRSVSRERAELIATMHRREDPAVSTSDLIGWATHDLRERVSNITCPSHLVVGTDDLWLNVVSVQATADQIPRGLCTVLDGIGHYPMEEIDGFGMVLDGWLRGLVTTRPDEVVA